VRLNRQLATPSALPVASSRSTCDRTWLASCVVDYQASALLSFSPFRIAKKSTVGLLLTKEKPARH